MDRYYKPLKALEPKGGAYKMTEEQDPKRDLKKLLDQSEYYRRRRQEAVDGKNVEEFIKELEVFCASIWRSLYDANQELVHLRENLGITETKSTKLEEMLLQQLFDSVTDGITN